MKMLNETVLNQIAGGSLLFPSIEIQDLNQFCSFLVNFFKTRDISDLPNIKALPDKLFRS